MLAGITSPRRSGWIRLPALPPGTRVVPLLRVFNMGTSNLLKLGVEVTVKPPPGTFADDLKALCEVATIRPEVLYLFFREYAADQGVTDWTCPALEEYLR